MPILKHTEYKIICENCKDCLTDWISANNQAKAIKKLDLRARQNGGKKYKNRWFCNACYQLEKKNEI